MEQCVFAVVVLCLIGLVGLVIALVGRLGSLNGLLRQLLHELQSKGADSFTRPAARAQQWPEQPRAVQIQPIAEPPPQPPPAHPTESFIPSPPPAIVPAPAEPLFPTQPPAVDTDFISVVSRQHRAEAPAQPPASPTPAKSGESLEVVIGQRWLSYVGITATLAAVAFFLHLAYVQSWMPNAGRVAMISLGGFVMIGLGQWFNHKRYRALAMVLLGGGPAAIFAAGMFAWLVYGVVQSPPIAFAWMVGVSVLTVLLALHHDSIELAIVGLVGGFAAPIVIGAKTSSDPNYLMLYVLLLDAGVLALSYFKQWRLLNHLLFLGTAVTFVLWAVQRSSLGGGPFPVIWAVVWLSVYLLLFWSASTVVHVARPWERRIDDYLLAPRDSICYAVAVAVLLLVVRYPADDKLLGRIYFGLAALNLVQCVLLTVAGRRSPIAESTAGWLAAVAATLAVPLALSHDWIQLGWAAIGLAMLYIGVRRDLPSVRAAGSAVFGLVGVRLLQVYAIEGRPLYPLLNSRSGSVVVIALACAASAHLWRLVARSKGAQPEPAEAAAVFFNVASHVAVVLAFTAETLMWFADPKLAPADAPMRMEQFILSGGYAVYAIGLVVAGFLLRRRVPRVLGLLLFALAAVKVCIFDVAHLSGWMRIGALFVLGLMMLVGSWLYYRNRDYLRREFLGLADDAPAEP